MGARGQDMERQQLHVPQEEFADSEDRLGHVSVGKLPSFSAESQTQILPGWPKSTRTLESNFE